MTAQSVFPPWKKIVGSSGWIIDEVALMCLGHSFLHWCQKLDETESECAVQASVVHNSIEFLTPTGVTHSCYLYSQNFHLIKC